MTRVLDEHQGRNPETQVPMGPTSSVGESEAGDYTQFSLSLPHIGRDFKSVSLTLKDVPKTGVFDTMP